MKTNINKIGRKYGIFEWKDIKCDEFKGDKWIKKNFEVYRWESGELTFCIDNQTIFIIKEKELIEGIKSLPKIK